MQSDLTTVEDEPGHIHRPCSIGKDRPTRGNRRVIDLNGILLAEEERVGCRAEARVG